MRTEITLDPNTYSRIEIRRYPEDPHDPKPKDVTVFQDGKGQVTICYGYKTIFDERNFAQNETTATKDD